MADAPHSDDEADRLEALERYEILDSPAEPLFDDFTHLAAQLFDVPISLISLVDAQRQWFKSKIGIERTQTPREMAFCAHALANPTEILVVPDAHRDDRFARNALVTGEPYIRFYAGAPLVTPSGHALGTLCVIDRRPRTLTEEQEKTLKMLARQVVSQLEARRNLRMLYKTATDLSEKEESLQESRTLLSQANAQLEERVQQKTAELAASQKLYEDLYQNAPDLHVSVDPNNSCILQCNHTLLSELGYTRQEIVGQTVYKLHHPSNQEDSQAIMQAFRSTGKVSNHEMSLARKDGSALLVTINVSAIRDDQGKIVASRSVCRDITEQKRLEEEAKSHRDQLAHLLRVATINEMATGIAHELNQPLNAIKNYAQGALLRLEKQSLEPAMLTSIFEEIVSDADRAAELILSLRRFVKPSSQQTAQAKPMELVTRVVKMLSREIKQHGSRVSVAAAENLPPIDCDTVQIKQVLVNLILNAAEALSGSAAEDREIKIVVAATKQQTVRFEVVDRGPGLGEADIDRLFETFYTTKESGLGMGLPICRTIVEAHGGSLSVARNKGPGLTISFELPISVSRG